MMLPASTTAYIAHPPSATLDDVVRVACRAQEVGLPASPHLVSRRLPSGHAPHFFAFGRVAATAQWLRAVADERSVLDPDGLRTTD